MDILGAEIAPAIDYPLIDYGSRGGPSLTPIGAGALPGLAEAAALAGVRLSAGIGYREAACAGSGPGGLIVDARRDGGAALDATLDALDAASARGRGCIVVASLETIDIVAARIRDAGVDVLIDPSGEMLRTALADLVARDGGASLREDGDADRRRLADLREEVGRIGRHLASLAGQDGTLPVSAEEAVSADAASDGAMVRAVLRMRRLRDAHFAHGLFADPAWDILLDLTAARGERRAVAVSSLCIAAAVPPTTALRWISTMADRGLLVRRSDPEDGRRAFVATSDGAAAAMSAYLAAARRVMAPAA